MEAFAAPDEDTTTGGDEEFVDDYLAPPYDTYDSSDNEDLAWYEGEGETWDEEYDWSGEEWCEEPDDLVCDYVE